MRPASQSLHNSIAPAWNTEQMRMAPGAAAAAAAARTAENSSANNLSSSTTSKSASGIKSAASNVPLEDRIQAICKKLIHAKDVELSSSHLELLDLDVSERWEVLPVLWNEVGETIRLPQSDRHSVGQITAHWILSKTITSDDYRKALQQFLETLEDLIIDIPKIDQYLVDMLGKYTFIILSLSGVRKERVKDVNQPFQAK